MAELNEPQARAVAHADGPLLVFAGAGSGKTRVITYRVANLLAEHRVPPYRILAVTFTNKAAGEMRERLELLAGADLTADLWVGTFHSVCARLLRRYHDAVGLKREFVIYDDADQKAVVARIIKDRKLDDREYPPKLVLSRIHAQKRDGILPEQVELSRSFDETVLDIYERYQKALLQSSAVDFDDLLIHVMRLAEDPHSIAGEELRGRFRYVLVDEFQDTNRVQYRLVRALSGQTGNLCVVGDDDQSIYRWRGADVSIIRGFRHDFPGAEVVKLEQNYRSTANIVAAALGVISSARDREPKKLWTEADGGSPVVLRAVRDERDEAACVTRAVRAELDRGTDPGEIAVFYRVHAQSRVLEEAFRSENLPYHIVGGMRFFERAEVKDLLAYLKALVNPRSDQDLLRIINTPTRGLGQKTLGVLLDTAAMRDSSVWDALEPSYRGAGLGAGAKKKLRAFHELMEQLRSDVEQLEPHQLAERVLEATGYRRALRDADNAEADARLENLAELVGSLQEYELDCESTGEEASLLGYLERISLASAADSAKDGESVSLMTVHSAKGLEFDVVMLTGMEEEIFPYRGLDGAHPEELDEERRLAYVAVTRARQRLYVTHAGARTLFGQTRYLSPSRFLADMPREVTVSEGSTGGDRFAGRPRLGGFSGARGYGGSGSYGGGRAPAAPRLEPGERVVDTAAFDDIPDGAPNLHPGDRVHHRRFGEGVVRRIEMGSGPTVVAHFPGFGERKIKPDYLDF